MDDFYAARTANTTALPWSNFAPPFSPPALHPEKGKPIMSKNLNADNWSNEGARE